MRKELKKIGKEERHQFQATFKRFGTKQGYRGGVETTVLLVDIKTMEGKEVTDHLWFNYVSSFQKLNLKEDDKITFFARVAGYNKRSFTGVPHTYIEKFDYKLSHPTKAEKVN